MYVCKYLTFMQKSTASPISVESANLQLQHAILRQTFFIVAWSCMVFRYFFLQHIEQQLTPLSELRYAIENANLCNVYKFTASKLNNTMN